MARSGEGESIKTSRSTSATPLLLLLVSSFGCRTGKSVAAAPRSCEERIIPYSEWLHVKNPRWTIDIEAPGEGRLLYMGEVHSDNPADAQFQRIDQSWEAFRPTVAFYEGPDRGVADSREDTIRRFGESGYVRFLAKRSGIAVHRLNPPPPEQLAYLLDRFPSDQVSLFFFLNEAARLRELKEATGPEIDSAVQELMRKTSSMPRGQEMILDIPRLEAAYRRYWTEPADWRQAPRAWFTPDGDPRITGGIFTNTVNQASSEFRDRHMVKVLSEAALRGARVLAVVGRNHVPMQAPALECLLKRDLELERDGSR